MYSIETILIFSINSDILSPNEIEQRIGLKGDKILVKGENLISPNGKASTFIHKLNSVKFYKRNADNDPEDVLQDYLNNLQPSFKKISDLKDVSIGISLGIYHNGTLKGFSITQEIMHGMLEINAQLDIALYDNSK